MYFKSILIGVAGVLIGALLFKFGEVISLNLKKRKRKKKVEEKGPTKKASKIEFSKIVLTLILSTYFLGLYIGYKTVLIDFTQLSTLLAYIGAPTATAIGFYSWKAKAENIIKIKQEHPKETEGVNIDLNNIIP